MNIIYVFGLMVAIIVGNGTFSEAKGGKWEYGGKKSGGTAGAWGTAEDGRSELEIGCNQKLGRSATGSFNNYIGKALMRIDDHEEPVIFEITDANGKIRSINGTMNYFAPDKAWAFRDVSIELLDAFGHGNLLILRNKKGDAVARFNLNGAPQARAFMKDVCGF